MKRYVDFRVLGSGTFGTSSVVEDTKAKGAKSLRVKKVLDIAGLKKADLDDTLKEIRYFGRLRHPAVTKLFDLVVEGKTLSLIREHCETSLDVIIQNTMKDGQSINETQIINWYVQVLFGLYYLHEKKILHKNLKPSNILIQSNTAKLTDMGFSRVIMHNSRVEALFPFTPHYLAPEVVTYRGYVQASDVWSLGCILYEMCTLRHAFDFTSGSTTTRMLFRIVNTGAFVEPPRIPSNYSPQLQRIIDLTLVRQAQARPTCGELLRSPFISKHILQLLRILPGDATEHEIDENVAEIIANMSINPRKRDNTFISLHDYIRQSGPELTRDFLPKKKDEGDEDVGEEAGEEGDEYPDELPETSRRMRYLDPSHPGILNANYKLPLGDKTQVPHVNDWVLREATKLDDDDAPSPCTILREDEVKLVKILPVQLQREQTGKADEDETGTPGKSPDENESDDEQGPSLARTPSAKRDLIMFDPANVFDPYQRSVGEEKYALLVGKAVKAFGSRYDDVHDAVAKAFSGDGWMKEKQAPQKLVSDNFTLAEMLLMEQIIFLEICC